MSQQMDSPLQAQIETLGREVYGDDFEKFLVMPRGSLDWETPAALLERGDFEPVPQVLAKMASGNFT